MSFGNTTKTQTSAPVAPARSKYAGISSADTRDPMADIGTYRAKVASCTEGYNPGKRRESYKVTLQILEASPDARTLKGSTCTMVCMYTNAGLAELKRFAVHSAGFGPTLDERGALDSAALKKSLLDAEAQYNALDVSFGGEGLIIEASAGHANGAPSLVGRIVDVVVSRGKEVINAQTQQATGDFYRQYTWGVVPDAEQSA